MARWTFTDLYDRLALRKTLAARVPDPNHPRPTHMPGTKGIDDVDQQRLDPTSESASRKFAKKYSNSVGGHHGLQYDFRPYLKNLQSKAWCEMEEHTTCVACGDRPDEPWVTSCFHICKYTGVLPRHLLTRNRLSRLSREAARVSSRAEHGTSAVSYIRPEVAAEYG